MLRQGSGEPLVLLHGVLCAERVWNRVVPLVATHHDVIVPTALGHNGGPPAKIRPASIEHVIDDMERQLDELGLDKVHLAGNSMGGWIAIELARRGRALTVCALSPAGAWDVDWDDMKHRSKVLSTTVRDTRRSRAMLPLLVRSKRLRHWILRDIAVHGERVSPAELLALADDTIGCEIVEDLLATDAQLAPLDPPPCPVTLAWSGQDRLFPVDVYGSHARELIPRASFIVLDDVGHVPMLDDPQLVAQTILASSSLSLDDRSILPIRSGTLPTAR
jgi:pimeloyl-ACP methyl ester carboxylesterase